MKSIVLSIAKFFYIRACACACVYVCVRVFY